MAVQEMWMRVIINPFGMDNTASLDHFLGRSSMQISILGMAYQVHSNKDVAHRLIIRAPGSLQFSTPDHFVIKTAFSTGGGKKACAHV